MEDLKDYIKISQAAVSWGITERRVQALCLNGKIAGAIRLGRDWMIPKNAQKPIDGRSKEAKLAKAMADENMPLPRKTPILYMTDLYREPGTADICAEKLAENPEARVLFEAEIAYSRGDIDKVYERATYLLEKHSGFFAILSAGMLLAKCAIWRGDLAMWRAAKRHVFETRAQSDFERDVVLLTVCAVDIMLYNVTDFPAWFKIGCFDSLPPDSLPAARVYYARYLYAAGYAVATGQLELPDIQGLSLMSMLPYTIEPMASQARASRSLVEEICLRMSCAAAYHNSGDDVQAVRHIDRAVELALPDRLYGLLAEYFRVMDSLLEQRIRLVSEEACKEIKALYKVYNEGWSRLSGTVRGKKIVTTLSQKEREVAKLAAFGMGNAEIAEKLHMSVSVVKQAIRVTMEKSGVSRKDFASIL